LSPLLALIDVAVPYDIAPRLAKILGNTLLLDNMLPVTEAYALVVIALTFKLAIFSYKVVWIVIDFTKYVSSYVLGVRM